MAIDFEIADALRACLEAAYAAAEDEGAPGSICIRAGAEVPLNFGTAQDECCSGLGWVRVVRIEPVTLSPGQTQVSIADNPCQLTTRLVTFELGVARCSPFGTQQAGPTCVQWTELARRISDDAQRMRQAVCCYASSDQPRDRFWTVREGTWEPMEISGMCAGGTMQATVEIDCGDC